MNLKFHPISDIFPMMSEQEFAGLLADMRENGQREPILVDEDERILDGRNRYRACKELELEPKQRTVKGNGSVLDLVYSMNFHRRHLTSSQRAEVGADTEKWLAKEAKKRQGSRTDIKEKIPESPFGQARDQAAKKAGTNGRYISDLKAAFAKAPELKGKVKDGTLKVKEARALADMPKAKRATVLKRVKAGAKFKEAKREAIREAKAIPSTKLPDACTLLAGDLLEASLEIPEGSIDCIITDPPYSREFIPAFHKLAEVAARCLKPGGSLLIMSGQSYLPDVIAALVADGLNYHWTVAYLTPGGQSAQVWQRKVNTFWKPVLWYVKGKYEGDWIGDVAKSATNDNDKRFHEWGQSESGMADLVGRFTYPGHTILDPFLGGGTTGLVALKMGRKFIGIDADQKALNTARLRLSA